MQRWAKKAGIEAKLNDFTASGHWVNNFKKKYFIVSRKVTKQTTARKKQKLEPETLEQFKNETLTEILEYCPKFVYNTDQVRVVQEIHRFRTLSHKGEKDTILLVQTANALTHLVTVMQTINLQGTTVGKLLICLKESANVFGPLIEPKVKQLESVFPFIKLTCSKSGKLSKDLVGLWIRECFLSVIEIPGFNKCLLLLDSWAGQWNSETWKKNWPENKIICMNKIPEGTTGEVQPLDVGLNSFSNTS